MLNCIVLLPGENIPTEFLNQNTKINRESIAINSEAQELYAKQAGIFEIKQQKGNKNKDMESEIMINHTVERYYPQLEDFIIGIIKSKTNDFYTLNIGAPQEAVLNALDFQGASKKNKPNLEIGQLVYCRIISTNKYLRPRVTCINPKSKKEWVTGETLFGDLKGGVQFQISITNCQNLKNIDFILKELQKLIQFEIAIGKNGRVWVKCVKEKNTIMFINTLKAALDLPIEQITDFISGVSHLFIK